jgi:tetratricopeptide (TPR) repeat protein
MNYEAGEARIRRQRTKEAISLAMQGRWDEAASANKGIIEIFPNDINAFNRLGKALTELGKYEEAKEAYGKALKIDTKNDIARRNIRRLSLLKEVRQVPDETRQKVNPQLFIEETGKAGVVILEQLASREVLAKMSPGDPVDLKPKGKGLVVDNKYGERLGQIEPKIGTRLNKLIEGGNRYIAAIASSTDGGVRVIITEVFQHASQAGRPSFPARGDDGFRSYVKRSILKYELGEEEEPVDDSGEPIDVEEDTQTLPEGMRLLATEEDASSSEEES